jgi:methyl-accepting chemotaxis protein
MKLRNVNIGIKLALSFGAIIGLLVTMGLIGRTALAGAEESQGRLGAEGVQFFSVVADLGADLRQQRLYLVNLVNTKVDDVEAKSRIARDIESLSKQTGEHLAALERLSQSPEKRRLLEALDATLKAYKPRFGEAIEATREGKMAAALVIFRETDRNEFPKVSSAIDRLTEYAKANATRLEQSSQRQIVQAKTSLVTIMIAAVVVATILAVLMSRSLIAPIRALSERMESLNDRCLRNLETGAGRLAEGDLDYRVQTATDPLPDFGSDEIGRVCQTFNGMLAKVHQVIASFEDAQENLRKVVTDVRLQANRVAETGRLLERSADSAADGAANVSKTIQQVTQATNESALTSEQIAKGSEQLAHSSTEAASAMERLEEAVNHVRSGSEQQQQAASRAAQVAVGGGQAVQQTISSMERIQDQVDRSAEAVRQLGSKQEQIGAIVKTIDDIAGQTNLLALNAAIEAARAGEHGRGFAVVADEVRKLAERSGEATKEIAELIESVREGVEQAILAMESSLSEVASGAEHSASARQALQEILDAVKVVSELSESNDKLVVQMSNGAGVVLNSISAVASVSQETAAGAEEMSASFEELAASASEVASTVEQQSRSIREVHEMTAKLTQVSEQLKEAVGFFQVEDDHRGLSELRRAA